MDGFIHGVQIVLAIADFGSHVFGENVHQHQIKIYVGQICTMETSESGPFSKPGLKLGFVWAFWETEESPKPSHDHLFCPTFILLVQ